MEQTEFDATLGGSEHLPDSANSLKFAASRSVEIAAMTESILRPSKTKLIFQTLPVHMRRRVMSHNCKRLPRKLRQGHLEQLKKSGLPPKQKRPSRKYRRRPGNLLEEYNRRQKRNIWLETHIWHAKRFHMTERWGYRLAYAPCDKAFRACYRASSAHCLLQDISYYTTIQVLGPVNIIREMFSCMTNCCCGLGIYAKAYLPGKRQGAINLYAPNKFPFGYIGKINFVWVPTDDINQCLLLFVHPSQAKEVECILKNLSSTKKIETESGEKRRKLNNEYETLEIKVLYTFNRFRLTGPNSHAILVHSLKCVDNLEKIKTDEWISHTSKDFQLYLKEKDEYWRNISLACSPSQLSPNIVIGLVVRDPRLQRPSYRTKARHSEDKQIDLNSLIEVPEFIASSPLWNSDIHGILQKKRMTNAQFIEHITKTQLVPGEVNEKDPALQSIPIVLIQRPGSQDSNLKKIGYGSGWDIIVPSGYGLPFWQTFIMFGARSGGLRESENLAFEMGDCYLPPDSNAGREEEKRIETQLKDKYFRLPPSKRINYVKLGVKSPFICQWKILLKDWSNDPVNDFFVLRDKQLLLTLKECISKKKAPPQFANSSLCLIAVYLQIIGKGNLKQNALICLPRPGDCTAITSLFEPHHMDPNENLRKQKRVEHLKTIKQLRRKKIKMKRKGLKVNKPQKNKKKAKQSPSEYVKCMRELWLPSEIKSIRSSSSRDIIGFLPQSAFSFTEARSCGVGYVAYNALATLLNCGENRVLVRNKSSRKYRLANIQIISV